MQETNELGSEPMMDFAVGLQRTRQQLGFSLEGFADILGCHRTYAAALERGEVRPNSATHTRITEVLEAHRRSASTGGGHARDGSTGVTISHQQVR